MQRAQLFIYKVKGIDVVADQAVLIADSMMTTKTGQRQLLESASASPPCASIIFCGNWYTRKQLDRGGVANAAAAPAEMHLYRAPTGNKKG